MKNFRFLPFPAASYGVSSGHTRVRLTRTRRRFVATLLALTSSAVSGCYRNATPSPHATAEQITIDRATLALERMRSSGEFSELGPHLSRARGVMIFPHVVKAALVLGGGGGHGVLLVRGDDGSWSPPAFFGLGSGSAGIELGYQDASVVLVFENRAALLSAIENGLTLGADATVAAGTIGSTAANATATASRDVYTFVDAGGVFAGVALDGAYVGANETRDQRYYGAGATTYGIVIDRAFSNRGSARLRAVLAGG